MTSIDPRDQRIAELEALLEERYRNPSKKILKIPDIPEGERTPLVVALLEIIQLQQEQIQALKDEIARLRGQTPRP